MRLTGHGPSSGFDDWQRAHGMGEKTRRAYGADLGQLAGWAAERGLGPDELGHRELRHFAGVVSRARRREVDGRPQAGRDPDLLPAARRARRAVREPGRPRLEPEEGQVPAARAQAGRGERAARAHPRVVPARPARPRDARARLRRRAARRGAREPRHHRGRPRRRAGAGRGQGRPHARRPGRRARLEGARPLPGARAARRSPRATARRSSSPRAGAACRPRTSGAGCGCRPAAPASPRTRCATRSRPTYSKEEPICARFRSFWATPPSARPRPTLG